jgi:hypothetical protein
MVASIKGYHVTAGKTFLEKDLTSTLASLGFVYPKF